MAGSVLMGPFLTRAEAARAARIPPLELVVRRDVLRIGGHSLEEAYFAFQFDKLGIRADISGVVANLAAHWDHMTIAHWLARPNSKLDSLSPLAWLDGGRDAAYVVAAAASYVASDPLSPGGDPGIHRGAQVA